MKLIWTPAARQDRDDAWEFLTARNVAYAERVERRIEERASQLTRYLRLGRMIRRPYVRELSIPDIQYILVYRIEEDAIRILRVWSTRQNRTDP